VVESKPRAVRLEVDHDDEEPLDRGMAEQWHAPTSTVLRVIPPARRRNTIA
jgi:hypothetical protein